MTTESRVEEVLAESARPHRVGEVLARGRDDRDIRWLAPGAAEPPHRTVLEHLQGFAWTPSGNRPTSSRKRVPRWAV